MMPGKNRTTSHLLYFLIGLIFVWFCVEALSPRALTDNHVILQAIHGLLLFFLVISVVILEFINRKQQAIENAMFTREKVAMQRAADKSALRYKNLLECAGDAIFVINADTGRLEEMNSMGTELFGFSREEMGTLGGKDLIPVRDQALFISLVRRVTSHGMASEACITFKRKDGSRFLGEVNARLIDLGDEMVVQAIVRDISQKREAELEIRKRNRKLSILNSIIARGNQSLQLPAVLEGTLQETIELFGADGGAIHLREEGDKALVLVAQKNLGDHVITPVGEGDSAVGHPCRMTITQQCASLAQGADSGCPLAESARAAGWQSIAGIPLFARERLVGVLHILNHAAREYTPDEIGFFMTMGNQIGIVIAHARMFEELNWKNEELLRSHRLLEKNSHKLALSQNRLKKNLLLVERANLELERLDRMKNHFIGMMSHEFRTPLTGILSSAEYLLATCADSRDEDERRLLGMIHTSGTRLNEIVTDLLKVARLEAKIFPISKTALSLQEILDLLQEQFAQVLEERRQSIVLQGMESLPFFNGDREYLEEIFVQLLENAIKFTPDGGEIRITASVTERALLAEKEAVLCRFNQRFYDQMGCACYLQVEVRDSGIGIDSDEQQKIFDKFYEIGDIRYHSTGKHKFQGKGTGLGLAIVKGMVEAHGGMVWVESPAPAVLEGSGSAFFLLLPLEEGSSQPVFPFMLHGIP
jgi:PAS domain S-box-containing protein